MRTWIQTATGLKFEPLDPSSGTLDIRDIAHALANQCRFTGHTRKFYSVAEHSVRVARRVMETHPDLRYRPRKFPDPGCTGVLYGEFFGSELAFAGLMHDAPEAYLCDLATPLKQLPEFAFYRKAEDELMKVIANHFGIEYPFHPAIRNADEVLLGTEARDLMGPVIDGWHFRYDHLPDVIEPWTSEKAEREFLALFNRLAPVQFHTHEEKPSGNRLDRIAARVRNFLEN